MDHMLNPEQQAGLRAIAAAAVAAERETGCPAELSAAQAALESGWLSRMSGRNNCFGVKATAVTGRELVTTHEWFTAHGLAQFLARGDGRDATLDPADQAAGSSQRYRVKDWFAAFDTLADGFIFHARLLQRGVYSDAWRQWERDHSVDGLIRGIGPHYATAPGYAQQVIQMVSGPTLSAAVIQARNEAALAHHGV